MPTLLSRYMNSPRPPQTFRQLLREGNRFTDRDFMKALGVGHPALKQREANPGLFTMRELLLLAKLLERPKMELIEMVLADMERNPEAVEKLEEAAEQVVGRKHFPRLPKEQKPTPGL